jgi:anti-sigma-K factor RskA
LEACAGYVLDALEPADARALEAHLAEGCAICDAELDRLSGGVWLLATSAPPHRAPASLRGRVLRAVRAEIPARSSRRTATVEPIRPRRAFPPAWAWVAAAALLAVLSFYGWSTISRLESELGRTRTEIARLRDEIEEERRWSAVATAPDAHVVQLAATPDGVALLAARVTYDPTSRRALVAVSNFTPPAGKDYQLWAIGDRGPSSLGVVRAGPTGGTVLRLSNVGDPGSLAAFAVSLESEGGSPNPNAPAGPIVMIGKIGG